MSFMREAGVILTAPFFNNLRANGWQPEFHWTGDVQRCADDINLPHEDYPHRVAGTEKAILHVRDLNEESGGRLAVTQDLIREVHRIMFPDHGYRAGQWRRCNVQVTSHFPPKWELMDNMMTELEFHYQGLELDAETLRKWYLDFETIHPFQDGNGRTGGAIVAGISFHAHGEYLTPKR